METLVRGIQVGGLLRRSAGLFIVLAAMVTALSYPFLRSYEVSRIDVIRARESGYLLSAKQLIHRDFYDVIGDLAVITHLPSLKDYLIQNHSWQRENVAGVLQELARNFERYDSVVVLGTDGRELLRIDRIGGQSVIVPVEGLKDHSDCACFEQAIELGHDHVYVSRMVVIPDAAELSSQKPMIYFARAVAGDNGVPIAAVVFHFRANAMLDELRNVSREDRTGDVSMLISKEGYWLSKSNARDGAAKIVFDKEDQSFARQFAAEWEQIRNREQGEFTNDNGLFLFSTVYPLAQTPTADIGQREAWRGLFSADEERSCYAKLVRWIPTSSLSATSWTGHPAGRLMGGAVYIFLAIICVAVSYAMDEKRRNEIVQRRAAELELQAYTDSLTAVWNRRYFHEMASRELARNKRNNDPLALLMLDIDHFKRVNDTYGHQAGDVVLKEFCHVVHDTLREIDIFARLGGEEFVALLPNTPSEKGEAVANRVCRAISNSKVVLPNNQEIFITVSIGVSCLPSSPSNLEEMLHDADLALYEAKQQGRNRVCLSNSCRVGMVDLH